MAVFGLEVNSLLKVDCTYVQWDLVLQLSKILPYKAGFDTLRISPQVQPIWVIGTWRGGKFAPSLSALWNFFYLIYAWGSDILTF